jgi:hypothetical protein
MTAPSSINIDPTLAIDFHVAEETPHVVAYKFWVLRAGDQWYPIGPEQTNDSRTDHWIFMPPMPTGSRFAYWLGLWGHKNTQWRVRLTVSQRDPARPDDAWIPIASWTETGNVDDQGNGGGVATLPTVPQVELL